MLDLIRERQLNPVRGKESMQFMPIHIGKVDAIDTRQIEICSSFRIVGKPEVTAARV
jgi:hypothetical protein